MPPPAKTSGFPRRNDRMSNVDRPLRVIQWTTGNIGRRSLHAIIGRDDMELVGVYAHGADKVGVDAAELSGWPEPTGVTATNDIDALLALKPDACCYNPLWPNIDELTRLLESGVNVCSSAAWITGGKQSPEDLERIRKACEKGNSTIFGSGAHPGMTNLVGMVLSGSCERVDEIRITESVDCSTYESAGTQTAMGFSQDPDTPGLAESVRRESEVFAESAAMMADAIGAKLDKITFDVTFTPATGDSDLGFMQIPKGTVGRRVRLPPRLGRRPQRRQRRLQLDHGRPRHAAQAAGARSRHPGLRPAQHANRAALPAAEGLDRARVHGPGHDLHRDAGDQRRARGRRRPARHRDAQGPAADHRPRRGVALKCVGRVWLCPRPIRSPTRRGGLPSVAQHQTVLPSASPRSPSATRSIRRMPAHLGRIYLVRAIRRQQTWDSVLDRYPQARHVT